MASAAGVTSSPRNLRETTRPQIDAACLASGPAKPRMIPSPSPRTAPAVSVLDFASPGSWCHRCAKAGSPNRQSRRVRRGSSPDIAALNSRIMSAQAIAARPPAAATTPPADGRERPGRPTANADVPVLLRVSVTGRRGAVLGPARLSILRRGSFSSEHSLGTTLTTRRLMPIERQHLSPGISMKSPVSIQKKEDYRARDHESDRGTEYRRRGLPCPCLGFLD